MTTAAMSSPPKNATLFRLALLLLILLTFGWRLHRLDFQSLWRDEVDAVYFALRDLRTTLAMAIQPAQNGVLYWLMLRVWFHWVGASEFALRFPSAVAGTVCVPLFWQVARFWLDPQPASPSTPNRSDQRLRWWACALLASNSYHLWYSQEGKMYTINIALALLASWFWWRALTLSGARRWLGYLVTVSLAMYTHLLMIMLIPVHCLWFLIIRPPDRQRWLGFGSALAGLTLPYLPMVWWQWNLLIASDKRTGFNFVPLGEMLTTLGLNYSYGFAPHLDLIWLTPLIFLALAGLLLGWSELPAQPPTLAENYASNRPSQPLLISVNQRFLMLLTWLILPIVGIYLLSLRQPVYTDRYVIWILPALSLLVVLGAQVVHKSLSQPGRVLALLLLTYICGFGLYTGWQQKSTQIKFNLRGAVEYVAAQRQADSLLILQIPHLQWAYRYFSSDMRSNLFETADQRLGQWREGLWSNGGQSDAQANAEADVYLRQITAGVSEVWVLLSEVEMWDARRLMDHWLATHGEIVEQQSFHGVEARLYRLHQ